MSGFGRIAEAEEHEAKLRQELVDARVAMVAAHEDWERSIATANRDQEVQVRWDAFQEACDAWSETAARHRRARRRLERLGG